MPGRLQTTLQDYYRLVKPGIVYGNALTAIAGFLFASKWRGSIETFAALIVGSSLVMAAACVYNNYIDRGIDRRMNRTKDRALAVGRIGSWQALTYASVLLISGFALLIVGTNKLTVIIGLIAFVDYVFLYGWSKRHSSLGTIVGSISGAAPVAAGYTAASGRLDSGAVLVFLAMVAWQMPHFYAIAMYRVNDYTAAGIPVLPRVRGMHRTIMSTLVYILLFAACCLLLVVLHYAGWIFLIVMVAATGYWFVAGFKLRKTKDTAAWGRKMFGLSLVVMMTLSFMLAVGPILP